MKVNIDLLDGCSVCIGDHGIVIDNDIIATAKHLDKYDYRIFINGCRILVFKQEIEYIA